MKKLILFALVALLGGNINAQTELLVNGNFSSGSTGWIPGGDWSCNSTYTNCCVCNGYAHADNGSGLPKTNLNGYLEQTRTLPSNTNQNSAHLSFCTSATLSGAAVGTERIFVYIYDNTTGFTNIITTIYFPSSTSYTTYTYPVPNTCIGHSITLGFQAACTTTAATIRVDEVSLSYTAGSVCTTPGTPVSVSGSATGQTSANLSWSAGNPVGSPTVTYYWVVGTSPSVTYGNGVAQGSTAGLSASTSALTCNTTYYLRVYANTSCNNTNSGYGTSSAFTTSACTSPCTTPGTPISLSGSSTGQTTANLSWVTGSPSGSATVTYYWVVGTSPSVTYGNGSAQGSTTGTSATASGLTCNTTYYLRVYAYTNCNGTQSGYATSSSFTTGACSSTSILGVDVSNYNGTISWPTVYAAGKTFAFVKATEGVNTNDANFTTNMTSSNPTPNNVILGAYHVAAPNYSSNNTAANEAAHFLGVASSYIGAGYLPPALDLEPSYVEPITSTIAQWVNDWCTIVHTNTGTWPVIYATRCDAASLRPYYTNGTIDSHLKLWIADWNNPAGSPGNTANCIWNSWPWIFHQYFAPQNAGNNPTTYADPGMDQDFFNGTLSDLNTLIGAGCTQPAAVNVSGSGTFCNSTTLTASGGSGGTIYWEGTTSNGTSTSNSTNPQTVTSSGTYYFRSYNGSCWGTQGSATVTINPTPSSVTVSGGGTYCNSATLTASGGSGGTIYWEGTTSNGTSTSNSTNPQTVTSSGTYYFRSGNGSCWGPQGSTTVTINPSPSVLLQATSNNGNLYCTGQSISLTANSSTTSYHWAGSGISQTQTSTGSNTATPTTSGNQTYSVTVTDANSCSATATTSVNVTQSVAGSVALIQNPNPACEGSQVVATATPIPSTGQTTYSWSGGAGSPNQNTYTISSAQSGTIIHCTATFSGACVTNQNNQAATTLSLQTQTPVTPSVTLPPGPYTVCINSNISIIPTPTNGGSQPTYDWWVDGSDNGSSLPAFGIVGTHTVYCIMTTSESCHSIATAQSNTVTVNVQTQAPAGINIQPTSQTICQGDTITFTATPSNGGGAPQYQWLVNGSSVGTGTSSFTASNFQNGDIITCHITSNSSCAVPDTATSNAITITVNPTPVANAGSDTAVCAGASVELHGSGGNTCQWSPITDLDNPNICNPIATVNTTRTYTLTVTENNCSATDQVQISIAAPTTPVASFSYDTLQHIIPVGCGVCFTNTSSNYTNEVWYFDYNNNIADSTTDHNPCHIYNSPGTHIVKLKVINSCGIGNSDNSTQKFVTISQECITSIEEVNSVNLLRIIPNPSAGNFTLSFETNKPEEIQIKIFDVIGQLVQEETPAKVAGTYTKEINLGKVAKGVYVLQLKAGEEIINRQIVIQ